METHVVFSQELPVKHTFVCEEGGWRPEADVGQDPKSSDATAAQPGKWHRANTQDKADQETFTQSVHAPVSYNTCINKAKLNDD